MHIALQRYKYGFLFLCAWVAVFLIYYPTHKGWFGDDYLNFLAQYKGRNIWQYMMLPDRSLYQGVNLVHYLLIRFLGVNGIAYLLVFTALHAIVGVLAFKFFCRLSAMFSINNYLIPVSAGVILFLISPLCNEVIIWKACSHYLTSSILFLSVLLLLLSYLETNKKKYIFLSVLVYYISTFFIEFFFITPIIILFILIAFIYSKSKYSETSKKAIKFILLPIIATFFIYFITFRLVIGNAIPRVSGGDAKVNFELMELLRKAVTNFAKITAIPNIFPPESRKKIYQLLDSNIGVSFVVLILLSIAISGIWFYKKISASWQYLLLLSICLCLCLLMALPLWFDEMNIYQGNRYFYLAAIFFTQIICFFIYSIFRQKKITFIAYVLLACIYLYLCFADNFKLKDVFNINESVLTQIRQYEKYDTIITLSTPAYYKEIACLGSQDESIIQWYLDHLYNDSLKSHVYEAASVTMHSITDGAKVKVIDNTHFEITVSEWGNWFNHKGFGLSKRENEMFEITPNDGAFVYQLVLNNPPGDNTVLLFYNQKQLKKVDLKLIGVDQY